VLDPAPRFLRHYQFGFAISQLAQTTLRSEIGKIELDRNFRGAPGQINTNVVSELGQGFGAWGVKVSALRNQEHHAAEGCVVGEVEKQMRAEREKPRRRVDLRGRTLCKIKRRGGR